jgi:uncharacterized protein with PQ loop repeat
LVAGIIAVATIGSNAESRVAFGSFLTVFFAVAIFILLGLLVEKYERLFWMIASVLPTNPQAKAYMLIGKTHSNPIRRINLIKTYLFINVLYSHSY